MVYQLNKKAGQKGAFLKVPFYLQRLMRLAFHNLLQRLLSSILSYIGFVVFHSHELLIETDSQGDYAS